MTDVHTPRRQERLSDGAPLRAPMTGAERRALRAALAPWRAMHSPRFFGLENIPSEGPALLVGNHTIYGLLDVPLMADEIIRRTGRVPRGLAENAHYALPVWRDLLARGGAVRGTRENCRLLFEAGELVMVFPGGGREVAKRKGEKYELLWKERRGFAQVALDSGVPIVPFAAVGVEDALDIVLDADHPALAPVKGVVERLGGRWELALPLARGIGPTPLPRPERFYYWFGRPIVTAGRARDERAAYVVRKEVEAAVSAGISMLRAEQSVDPGRGLLGRVTSPLRRRA